MKEHSWSWQEEETSQGSLVPSKLDKALKDAVQGRFAVFFNGCPGLFRSPRSDPGVLGFVLRADKPLSALFCWDTGSVQGSEACSTTTAEVAQTSGQTHVALLPMCTAESPQSILCHKHYMSPSVSTLEKSAPLQEQQILQEPAKVLRFFVN